MKQFSIGEALSFGWETWKSNALLWIGVIIVVGIVDALPQVPAQAMRDNTVLTVVLGLVAFVISTIVQIGLVKLSLSFVDTGRAEFADLFNGYSVFVSYLIAAIIFAVMFGVGLVFLVVPGIIVAVIFGWYSYAIVDRGMGPIDALQRSMDLTRGVRMDIFLFGLAVLGLNLLGMIPCFLGLFITLPMTMMAGAYIYRRLDRETPLGGAV
jgi:uncharacterized membrane protein